METRKKLNDSMRSMESKLKNIFSFMALNKILPFAAPDHVEPPTNIWEGTANHSMQDQDGIVVAAPQDEEDVSARDLLEDVTTTPEGEMDDGMCWFKTNSERQYTFIQVDGNSSFLLN